MTDGTVAIIGLGLLGGSLARDLADRGVRVLGYDRDTDTLHRACMAGAVHETLDASLSGLRDADVLVLAVPVGVAADVLRGAAPHADRLRLITDVGSTKRGIATAVKAAGLADRFVGGHPLVGDHRSGWLVSRAGMFEGARVYLTPSAETSADSLRLAKAFWVELGARTQLMPAEEHDRQLAWTSHLPQAAATALARVLDSLGIPPTELGSGGRDATRLAASAPDLWTAIATENADMLVDAVAALEEQLAALRDALARADERAVKSFFEAGVRWSGQSGEGPSAGV